MPVDNADRQQLDEAAPPKNPDGSVAARGYYADPLGGARRRFWDGSQWSIIVEDDAPPAAGSPLIRREAATVEKVGWALIFVGWALAGITVVSGFVLWSELSSDDFDAVEYTTADKLSIVIGSVGIALVGTLMILAMGYALRLFALHVSAQNSGDTH